MRTLMAGESPTTVRYMMTVDDLVDGQRLVQRPLRRFGAVLAAVLAIGGVALALMGDTVLGAVLIFDGILVLAILVAGRPAERFGMRRRAARLIGNECEVSLTDSVVTFRCGGTKGEIGWSDLTGIREDAHTLGFASGGVLRLGIPKRAFASEADLAAFRRRALARISSAQVGAPTS
jgi:hypothetical protein